MSKFESNDIEKLRKCGENEQNICQLIREDKIEEFITFVSRNDLPLSTKIKPSIFETNLFLIDKEPSLIEYSAFFGSIQIFKYLSLNGEPLTPSLWLFAIHGNNPEVIHFLEEKNIIPENESLYKKILNESIKCHHIEITEYIKTNYDHFNNDDYSESFKSFNFIFFPENLLNESSFFYLCKYNYLPFVELIINSKDLDINKKTI